MAKKKISNRGITEIKHGVLYMAEQLGTESKLRALFNAFEKKAININSMTEVDVRTTLFKMSIEAGCMQELQTAMAYFDRLPAKRPNEQESRAGIVATAERMGISREDVLKIFNKYDTLLKRATSENERQDIAAMGAAEVHRLLNLKGALVVDDKLILPAEEGYEDATDNVGKFSVIH